MEDGVPKARRVPIVMGGNTIALLTMFTLPAGDNLDDLWAHEWIASEIREAHKKSAKQFIDAMEGRWSPAFLMALRYEITKVLADHDVRYGTAFAERGRVSQPTNEQVTECLRRLVYHDRAAADREGYEGCIELQNTEEWLKERDRQ